MTFTAAGLARELYTRSLPICRGCLGSAAMVCNRLHGHGGCQDDHVVLTRLDLDTIRVRHAEPLLRHFGDFVAVGVQGVLVIQNIALNLQVRAVAHVDGPPLTQRCDKGLLNGSKSLAAGSLDHHRILHPQHALLDLAELTPVWVLEDERVAHAQCLAVHLEGVLAAISVNVEIVPDRDQTLAHLIARGVPATPKGRALVLPVVASLVSASVN